jgi:hypothetical protein
VVSIAIANDSRIAHDHSQKFADGWISATFPIRRMDNSLESLFFKNCPFSAV